MDALAAIERLGRDNQGLVAAGRLRAAGVCTRDLERAGADVVRIMRGVYGRAPLPSLPRFLVTAAGPSPAYIMHVRAVLLSMGGQAAARTRTAAVLRGWALLVEPGRTVEVGVPHGRSSVVRRGVKVRQYRQLAVESLRHAGAGPIAVTSAVQTAVDCCLLLPLGEAVVACDSALRSGQLDLGQLHEAGRSLPGQRDAARVRRVLGLCDPQSGSVLESVLRLAMVLDGLNGFRTQAVLQDSRGTHVLRADFCFDEARLVVEVDGQKWHQEPARDRERDNGLARIGFRVLRYTWSDVIHDRERVLTEIREALFAPQDLHLAKARNMHTLIAA